MADRMKNDQTNMGADNREDQEFSQQSPGRSGQMGQQPGKHGQPGGQFSGHKESQNTEDGDEFASGGQNR